MAIVASETYTSTSAPIQYAAITAFQDHPEIDEYLYHSRRILKTMGTYMASQLKASYISFPQPKGGFYLFPNFEYFREKLASRGILTSVELCETLLRETGVAILPGMDFGRQPEELTCRLAYVDFDGELVLNKAMTEFREASLTEDFLKEYCSKMVEATRILATWFNTL